MAIIFHQTIDNTCDMKRAFDRMGRDDYPIEVYESIIDLINETTESDYYELDVIAWCCDISETSLDDENRALKSRGVDKDDLYTLDEITKDLQDKTTVLYVDEDDEVVYHLAY